MMRRVGHGVAMVVLAAVLLVAVMACHSPSFRAFNIPCCRSVFLTRRPARVCFLPS